MKYFVFDTFQVEQLRAALAAADAANVALGEVSENHDYWGTLRKVHAVRRACREQHTPSCGSWNKCERVCTKVIAFNTSLTNGVGASGSSGTC